jgi:hypothetical protein
MPKTLLMTDEEVGKYTMNPLNFTARKRIAER